MKPVLVLSMHHVRISKITYFATSEPTKIAAATNTIHPDWAMSNWYEMKMPDTVADTAKHIESIIVFLKERA